MPKICDINIFLIWLDKLHIHVSLGQLLSNVSFQQMDKVDESKTLKQK